MVHRFFVVSRGSQHQSRIDKLKEAPMRTSNPHCARGKPGIVSAAGLGVVSLALVFALGSAPGVASAQGFGKWGGPIDPDALQILKGMTDYLGGLQQFSLHTENTYDDVLATGQKIQFHFSSDVVIQRPNKLFAERTDGGADRLYYYDGETLVLYDAKSGFFSVIAVPDTLDAFLHFASDSLNLVPPAGDLMYSNAFQLLTANITSGFVVGEDVIGGVTCHHLAFTSPLVDWQVWVADGDQPLPYRYVLTTMDDPTQPQFMTTISKWNTSPEITDEIFEFDQPATAVEVEFVGGGGSAN